MSFIITLATYYLYHYFKKNPFFTHTVFFFSSFLFFLSFYPSLVLSIRPPSLQNLLFSLLFSYSRCFSFLRLPKKLPPDSLSLSALILFFCR